MQKYFLKFDWVLFIVMLLLLGISLAALYPISIDETNGVPLGSHFFRQLGASVFGLILFLIFSLSDYRSLKASSMWIYLAGIILLVAVLVVGKVIRGTTGWIDFGIFNVQVVEPFKIIAAVALAKYFSSNIRELDRSRLIVISFVPILVAIGLILYQPDLGSAAIVFSAWFSALVLSGVPWRKILAIVLIIAVSGFLAWGLVLKGYQKERILALADPYKDPLGSGYNVIQSTVAVGSGGWWGKGLGHGSQSQLNFLPEKHTDFIFAVISEEMGFAGAIAVLSLYLVLIFRLYFVASLSQDNFGRILVGLIAFIIFIQAGVNIGMNIGLAPVAGIPLPLLSYGGSSLMTVMASLGIAQSVARSGKS